MVTERPLLKTDLNMGRFACVGNKIEPSVASDASLSGTGSTANPLSVVFPDDHTTTMQQSASVNAGFDPAVTHVSASTAVINIAAQDRSQLVKISSLGLVRFVWSVGNTAVGDLLFEIDTGSGFFTHAAIVNISRSLLLVGHSLSVQFISLESFRPCFVLAASTAGTIQTRITFNNTAGVGAAGTAATYTFAVGVFTSTV